MARCPQGSTLFPYTTLFRSERLLERVERRAVRRDVRAREHQDLDLLAMILHGNVVGERSEEHTSELQSRRDLVCRLLLEKKKERAGPRAARGRRVHHQGCAPSHRPRCRSPERPALSSQWRGAPKALHSFPTRRSSDLSAFLNASSDARSGVMFAPESIRISICLP